MTDTDRKRAAKAFAEYWKDRGDEKSDSQSFWLSFAFMRRFIEDGQTPQVFLRWVPSTTPTTIRDLICTVVARFRLCLY